METYAHTPREALLIIRAYLAGVNHGGISNTLRLQIETAIDDGLSPTRPETFELTDQLADRLAEAHNLLLGLKEGYEDAAAKGHDLFSAEFKSKFDEALALPPDLEAMVERRIGHG